MQDWNKESMVGENSRVPCSSAVVVGSTRHANPKVANAEVAGASSVEEEGSLSSDGVVGACRSIGSKTGELSDEPRGGLMIGPFGAFADVDAAVTFALRFRGLADG